MAASAAGGAYTFTGHSQPDVQYKANAIKTQAKGYRTVWFRDGDHEIGIVYPAYYMRGARACVCVRLGSDAHRHGLWRMAPAVDFSALGAHVQ